MPAKVTLDATAKYLPFLVEIRRRLLFLTALFVAASILGFIYYERIIKLLLELFHFQGVNIVFTSQFQFINLALNSSLILGLIIILPVITFQVLAFLKPALAPKEYRTLTFLTPFSFVLFLVGFVYGMLMMRSTLELFYRQSVHLGIGNVLDISTFLSQTITTSALLGLAFEFPLVFTVLMRFKVITHHWMAEKRLLFYLVAMIFVIFLPPPDILSDILLFLPLAILFELTLILNRVISKIT